MVRFGAQWMKEKSDLVRERRYAQRERFRQEGREEGREDILNRLPESERIRILTELETDKRDDPGPKQLTRERKSAKPRLSRRGF